MSQILCGNNSDVLDGLPAESVDAEVESPPYYHQREYEEGNEQIYGGDKTCTHAWKNLPVTWRKPSPGDKPSAKSIAAKSGKTNAELRPAKESKICACGAWLGDLGLEPTPKMYIDHLCGIYDKVRRVLKPTGLLVVNIGEKYNDSGGGPGGQTSSINNKAKSPFVPPYKNPDIPKSSALCIPWLFNTSMVYEHGWILKDTLIWQKKVPMPYSGDRKWTIDYEPIFVFAKNPDYYFNPPKVKKVCKVVNGNKYFGGVGKKEGILNATYSGKKYIARKSEYKNRRTNIEDFGDQVVVDGEYLRFLENVVFEEEDYDRVFKINTSKSSEKHHAMWPVELCRILIEMGCPPGGKVMDCFGGVGNTAIAAAQLNRDYILIELSEQHCKTAKRRVYKATTDRDFKRKATNLDGLR